jgi:hypothetical protein
VRERGYCGVSFAYPQQTDPFRNREADMRPRIKVVTLGVSNLERSLTFYRDGMGLPTKGIVGQEFEDGAPRKR